MHNPENIYSLKKVKQDVLKIDYLCVSSTATVSDLPDPTRQEKRTLR